jgi:hypothetical protein
MNNIVKIFILAIAIFLSMPTVYADGILSTTSAIKDYQMHKIPLGIFIRCLLLREISSEINKEGDIVYLQNPMDICVEGAVLLPKNTIFTGHILQINKAVEGQNGWFRFNIENIIFPDGSKQEIKAHILPTNSDGIVGGDLTARSSLRKVVHKSQGRGFGSGIAQLLPDGPRQFGKETKLKTGTDIVIQLDKDLYIIANP